MTDSPDLIAVLRRYWGYEAFRPVQERVVRSLLAGRDVAVVMPTGGGKSLCYQLPAVVLGRMAVVISPLIALMQDQAAQLAEMGIPAAVLNSTQPFAEQQAVIKKARDGAYRLLYLSPERLAREDTTGWLGQTPVSFFAIDEAHCISEWGHEFRPEYRQLGRLRERFPEQPIAAFTASATRRVRHDILAQLKLRDPERCIVSFHRPNLRYFARKCEGKEQERLLVAALAAHAGSNAIVYVPTIARVGETTALLELHGIRAVPYHGQMEAETRRRNQELWMSDEAPVLVGTIAFGLGINKAAVRAVIHLSLPKSIEQYYQEAGRAGRDGEPADCALLWQGRDLGLLAYFIGEMTDAQEKRRSWDRYHEIKRFAESDGCRPHQICTHFGETPKWEGCGLCDGCGVTPEWAGERAAELVVEKLRDENPPPPALMDHLRQWRRELSRQMKVPAYIVMTDATMADLCRKLPQSRKELRGVVGIGERKAELYGEGILATLAEFRGRTTP